MRDRGKKHTRHENHERWLVSYADFITLMFAFFVVMFASSQSDKTKVRKISEAVREALDNGTSTHMKAVVAKILGGTVDEGGNGNALRNGPGGSQPDARWTVPKTPQEAELQPSLEYLTAELKPEIKAGKMLIHLEARGLVVSLRQAAFFPSGEDAIDPATYASLEKVGAAITKLPNPVRLEGHTDSRPIHTARFRSNWELSAARAIALLELLTGRLAIPRERLAIAGYAETVPVAPNDTEEGRALNRRVDVVILNQQRISDEPAQVPRALPVPVATRSSATTQSAPPINKQGEKTSHAPM